MSEGGLESPISSQRPRRLPRGSASAKRVGAAFIVLSIAGTGLGLLWVGAVPLLGMALLAGGTLGAWEILFPARADSTQSPDWLKLVLAAGIYIALTITLSILQYLSLHVPHGDSGMYEEHVWNLWHGKGFRSQLDGGRSFLGEHVQVIHLLFLPLHILFPSLLTLNVGQSVALASGAAGVYLIGRRLGLEPGPAWVLGLAYLLYFPLQYLNLEASWKTFRPIAIGVPWLIFALASLEGKRYRTMLALLGISLLAQEDYAIAVAGIGLHLVVRLDRDSRVPRTLGAALIVASIAYLVLVLAVVIPHFRQGAPPHYVPYFRELGSTPGQIVLFVVSHPFEVLARMVEPERLGLVWLILVPLAMMPLASPRRLVAAVPVLGYLMLLDERSFRQPIFHFHAPVVPVLFWAAAGGIRNIGDQARRWGAAWLTPARVARAICAVSFATGVWYGSSPLSVGFYDSRQGMPREVVTHGSTVMTVSRPVGKYWKDRYLPGPRALEAFPAAARTIRPQDRVAATDLLRTRFTHCAAAHDWPTLRAHVTIDDLDVIILDETECWWGRGESNPDHDLLACMVDPQCGPGTPVLVRGRRFRVVYNDDYFLVVRRDR